MQTICGRFEDRRKRGSAQNDRRGNRADFLAFAQNHFVAVHEIFYESPDAEFEIPVPAVGGKGGIDARQKLAALFGAVDFVPCQDNTTVRWWPGTRKSSA